MFYEEFCRLANAAGKSPSACAVEMGFAKSEVTRWKQGTVPRHANLVRIADYFGVGVDQLKKEQPADNDRLSMVKQMLMMEIPQMSEEDASTLLILAKQLTRRGQSPGTPPKSE